MVDAATLEKLEAGFKKLQASDSKSLLKKYLTQEVFDKLKTVKTPTFGSSLLDVIQSGMWWSLTLYICGRWLSSGKWQWAQPGL